MLLNAYTIGLTANYYLEARTNGRYLVFVDKYADPTATMAFGALGGAISSKTRANILDMKKGVINEATEKYMKHILSNTDLFGAYLAGNKKPKDIIILVQKLNDLKIIRVEN